MGKTVRQLLREIDAHELAEWMAYDRIQPFGDDRADLRNAILCQITQAPHLKEGVKVPPLQAFMPFAETPEEEPGGLTGIAGAQAAKVMFGGR